MAKPTLLNSIRSLTKTWVNVTEAELQQSSEIDRAKELQEADLELSKVTNTLDVLAQINAYQPNSNITKH